MQSERWITLDYLEILCQKNQFVIGCTDEEEELWVSALGPHPSSLTSTEVADILRRAAWFEIRLVTEESEEFDSQLISRTELEKQIQRMMN